MIATVAENTFLLTFNAIVLFDSATTNSVSSDILAEGKRTGIGAENRMGIRTYDFFNPYHIAAVIHSK